MPPRLNKRQLRELEELSALANPDSSHPDEELEDDETKFTELQPNPPSGFAALVNQDIDDNDTDEGESQVKTSKSKKPKKKKKREPNPSTPAIKTQPPVQGTSSKTDKKALKKQKARDKKDGSHDLDRALAELSLKYSDLQLGSTAGSSNRSSNAGSLRDLSSLLSISVQHLDSEAEMRKFFGAKVVAAAKASSSGQSGASPSGRRPNAAQRSHLTRPKPTWWPAQLREGLSVRQLTVEELSDKLSRHGWSGTLNETWSTVEYSKKYRGVTLAFIQTVMSGDPEGFSNLLRALPYHADTLLQLSEVYNHREEYSTAADFVDRALFSYERSFLGSFNFTAGTNRLDFDRVENRPFFLALHRQVVDLQRRGCNRTAFEFAKLLYSLDPWSDPHGALLHLDSLAVHANMSEWLLEVWDFFESHAKDLENRLSVKALPGWWYARALALKIKSAGDSTATKALKDAIERFPSVLPLLADKIDLTLSSDIRGNQKFRIHTDASSVTTQQQAVIQLLCHLYVQRSFVFWKKPDHAQWLSETIKASLLSSLTPREEAATLLLSLRPHQLSIYRHVIVLEHSCRRLFSFIPKEVLNARQIACDPLPPASRINEYNSEFFRGVEDAFAYNPRRRNRREEQGMLERLIPDPVFRRQLQAFFEAQPQFAERFPGGIVQFAQIAAQLPEDALEDMMIAEADNVQGGDREMPGQMPGEQDMDVLLNHPAAMDEDVSDTGDDDGDDDDEEEEEEAEEDEISPLPVRILRNVFNRFFGFGRNSAETEQDSDEEIDGHEPRDLGGVD